MLLGPQRSALTGALLAFALPLAGQQLQYPPAPKGNVVDHDFGHSVPDPYRSLEDADAPVTKSWVEAENKLTFGYLDRLERRDSIRKRLTAYGTTRRYRCRCARPGKSGSARTPGCRSNSWSTERPPSAPHQSQYWIRTPCHRMAPPQWRSGPYLPTGNSWRTRPLPADPTSSIFICET